MKLSETRLAVAAELGKKLEQLSTAAHFIFRTGRTVDREELRQMISENPERALYALYEANTLLLLMRSEFLDCCDLANDIENSLEHGVKCVLVPKQTDGKTDGGEV